MSDRRNRVRFQIGKRTFCYLDGCRFDTETTDLSASGAFLATEDDISLGSIIVVLFNDVAHEELPVHLVGRVARHQQEPIRGIGVSWVRAVTLGDTGQLVSFLYDVLQVPSLETIQKIQTEEGRSWYEFDPVATAEPGGPDLPANVIPLHAGTAGQRSPGLYVVRTENQPDPDQSVVGASSAPNFRQDTGQGPITWTIHQDQARYAIDAHVTLTIGHTALVVPLTSIGYTGLTVRTDIVPADEHTPIMVSLQVPTRDGIAAIILSCEFEERIPPGDSRPAQLSLRVKRVVDEIYKGLFERYLKWLQCRDLSTGA